MNGRDIRARVLLVALIPAALIALLLTLFFTNARLDDLDEAVRQRGRSVAQQLAAAADYGVFSGNRAALELLADAVRLQSGAQTVMISDNQGEILARSGEVGDGRLPSEAEFLSTDGRVMGFTAPILPPPLPQASGLGDHLDGIPAAAAPSVHGRVLVKLSLDELHLRKWSLLDTSLIITVLLLVVTALLARRLSRAVTRPMEDIAHAVERISRGDFEARVATRVGGSLQRLAEQVNEMARQLGSSHEEMQLRILDATEELRLRKDEAERANMAKSRFLATASHDLRQPMHALVLFVAQLQATAQGAEAKLVQQIAESVQALDGLLDGLLDISKLDAGVLVPSVSGFCVAQALTRLAADHTGPAGKKGLYLQVRPSEAWVRTDPVLLERILLNLVSNAVRYTQQGGVLVACRRRGTHLRIEVRDSGPGIPAESQRAIFQEFVQLNNPGRNRSQGLGLGLAIVQRLAQLLNLRLDLISAPGRGSVFAVEVPLTSALAPAQRETAPPLGDLLQGRVVAVVDDDAMVLNSVVGLLESWGCVVIAGMSREQILARLQMAARPPEALLCDFRLSEDCNGIQMVQCLRQVIGETLPAVLVSGDMAPEVLRMTKEAGLSLLHKPVAPSKLRTLLHRMLTKA